MTAILISSLTGYFTFKAFGNFLVKNVSQSFFYL